MFCIYLSVFLAGNLISQFYLGQSVFFEIIRVSLVSWPLVLVWYNLKKFNKEQRQYVKIKRLLLIIVCAFFLSTIFSNYFWGSFSYSFITSLVLLIIYYFACEINYNFENPWWIIYALTGSMTCLFLLKTGIQTEQGRLESILNPNSLGMICVSIIYVTFFCSKLLYKILLLLLPAYTLITTNSRASIVGLSIGLIILSTAHRFKINPLIRYFYYCLATVVLIIFLNSFWSEVYRVVSDVLAFNDPYRGLGSGGTGRFPFWKEAWGIFLNNPFLGVGFRQHEQYMYTGSSSHNGYLATLAELGLIGFVPMLILILLGIKSLVINRKNRSVELAYVTSYLFISFFERYLVNIGNPTSLLFLFFIIRGCMDDVCRLKRIENAWR